MAISTTEELACPDCRVTLNVTLDPIPFVKRIFRVRHVEGEAHDIRATLQSDYVADGADAPDGTIEELT